MHEGNSATFWVAPESADPLDMAGGRDSDEEPTE